MLLLTSETRMPAPPPASSFPSVCSPEPAAPDRRFEHVVAAGVMLEIARVLSRVLAAARPEMGARTERIVGIARELVQALNPDRAWEFEVAARLSQIGWLALPDATRDAVLRGEAVSEEEWRQVASHPLFARDLIGEGGRLAGVTAMIERQREPRSLPGEPDVPLDRDRVALGAQILRVACDLEALMRSGLSRREALERLEAQPCEYDAGLVAALAGEPAGHVQAAP
jgi:response regulator RpfG family c-di-GMP phosphodiesterase